MEQSSQQGDSKAAVSPALGTVAIADSTQDPAGDDRGPPISPKFNASAPQDGGPVDSGVDAGSSSEYDQENSGDHVIQAHDGEAFSDEG